MQNPSIEAMDGFSVREQLAHITASVRRQAHARSMWTSFGALLLVLCSWISIGAGQPTTSPTAPEVESVSFRGNETFDEDELEDNMTTKETPSWMSQLLYRTLGEKFGSPPQYFNPATFDADLVRIQDFYEGRGFYKTVVVGRINHDSEANKVDLVINITEHERSHIDSVMYVGLDNLPPDVCKRIYDEPILQKGMPYESIRDAAEITRVLDILRNNGYPMARFNANRSRAERRLSTNNFLLTFAFLPGNEYRFDGVTVTVDPPREDITENLVIRQLDFQPGELYSREKVSASERNVNRLGLFETALVDTASNWDTTSSAIPMEVTVRPRVRNELSPELIVSNENNAFNLGFGLGYTNRNFFGDARTFNTRVRARTQSLGDILRGSNFRDPEVVGLADVEFQILQPYFFTRSLSGSWTTTISAEKQSIYILSILKNKVGLSNQFATYTYGFFDWTLERVNPEILQDTIPLQNVLQVLRQEEQPQFNSILTITLQRDKTNDIFSPTAGFFNSISLEESGVLPKLLPGIRRGLPFTQYYKATLLGRWYRDLTSTRFNILAVKMKTGYQNKYGESKYSDVRIPLNRRFFAGGSGSVRGWKARDLGAMPDELIALGGNFLFEGSVEMRVNHFRGFGKAVFLTMDNIWGVYFVDFGNVWGDVTDFKPRDIAVAAGMGFRYETFFGPFRIDYGFRVYDPKSKNIFQKQFFGETLREGVFHFGIGHAF